MKQERKIIAIEDYQLSRIGEERYVLHEQLALRRLKRLRESEERRREIARIALLGLRPLWGALVWLFTPAIPLRRDAPHLPPVPQHQWDKGQRYLQRFF